MSDLPSGFIRVLFPEMFSVFHRILLKNGFSDTNASICAHIFSSNSLEGVYTHGVNRFSKFIRYCREGYVNPHGEPSRLSAFGNIEQWDGNLGPGMLNALQATDRAAELASVNGLGCVALANTNHWMRGGYYGWHAARKGFVFIGWTNTLANMPAWGAVDVKLGNNPLVIAVPYQNDAIVIDMAMSQYSYGALDLYRSKDEKLPVLGGYDVNGNLTDDPGAILSSKRVLPAGYWKGAGLSLVLDILASVLSGGLATHEVSSLKAEHALSQVFIAIDLSRLGNFTAIEASVQQILDDYRQSKPVEGGNAIRYPGERAVRLRLENKQLGIPVAQEVWEEILAV